MSEHKRVRASSSGRKKLAGSAALAVLGDGWTALRRHPETRGAFDRDPVYDPLAPEKAAAVAVERVTRRAWC